MEQMMNMMLSMMQPSQDTMVKDSTKPTSKSESGNEFRDLMKRQLTKDAPKEPVKEAKPAEKNVSETPVAVQETVGTEPTDDQQAAAIASLAAHISYPIVEQQAPVPTQDTAAAVTVRSDAAETVVQTVGPQQTAMQQEGGQPQQQAKGDALPGQQQTVTQESAQKGVVAEDTAQTFEVRPQTQETKSVQPTEKSVQTAAQGEAEVTVTNEEDGGVLTKPLFRDSDTVPVKVSDTAAPQKQQETPDVETQVGTKLMQALKSGESKVQVQLTPENLGTVNVEITRDAQGALHILLGADNAQTRQLLERHAFNLQSVLAQQNANMVQVEVERGQEGRGDDGQREHSEQNPQQDAQQQGQHRQQERHERAQQDFIQQLRLGLFPVDAAVDAVL